MQVTAFDRQIARFLRPARQKHGVEFRFQLGGRFFLADMHLAVEDHAFRFHLADAALHDPLLQLEVGNAVAQKSAGIGVFLVDMDVVTGAAELLRGGKPGGAGPDDGNALAGPALGRLGRDPAFLPSLVRDGIFDRLDRHRHIFEIQRAGRLAGGRADAAGEFREIIGGVQVAGRVAPVAVIDEVVPVRDLVVHRTARMAIGNAAIHAARGLFCDLVILHREDEFPVMADTVRRGHVARILPFDFEKARNLSHCGLPTDAARRLCRERQMQFTFAARDPCAQIRTRGQIAIDPHCGQFPRACCRPISSTSKPVSSAACARLIASSARRYSTGITLTNFGR